MSKSLLSFEVTSVSYGYRLLQKISQIESIQVVEAAPLTGHRFWIFAECPVETKIDKGVDAGFVHDFARINEPPKDLKDAVYGLLKTPLQKYLAVAEFESVSSLLRAVHRLGREDEVDLIEIQPGRGYDGVSLLYFTGQDAVAAQKILAAFKNEDKNLSHFEIISEPSETFSQFFTR